MIMIIFYSTKKAKVSSSSRSISLCPQNIMNKYNMYMEMHIKWVIFISFLYFFARGVTSNSSITASKYFLLYFELLFFTKKINSFKKKSKYVLVQILIFTLLP